MKRRFDLFVMGIFTLLSVWSSGAFAAESMPQSAPSAIPVVNSVRFKACECPPLTHRQVESLLQTACQRLPGVGAEPWFVYARRNHIRADGDDVVASVLMKPDEQAGRVSKGWVVQIDTSFDNTAAAALIEQLGRRNGPASQPATAPSEDVRKAASRPTAARPLGHALRYVHVAPKDSATAGDVPSAADVPFEIPADFSDAELVEIVDFVRAPRGANSANAASAPSDDSTVIRLNNVDSALPILRIVRSADEIEVWTGTVEGIVSGRGQQLDLKRDAAGKLVVEGVSTWVS